MYQAGSSCVLVCGMYLRGSGWIRKRMISLTGTGQWMDQKGNDFPDWYNMFLRSTPNVECK